MSLADVVRRQGSADRVAASAATLTRLERARPVLLALVVPLIALVVWEAAVGFGFVFERLLPAPSAVLAEVTDLWARGELWTHILVTLQRVVFGFIFGTLAATVLGALTGVSQFWRAVLDPTVQALKAVPSLAWVPLFILWFGIFETSKVTLIAVGVFFPVYLNLMTGIEAVDRKLVEVGRIYRLSRLQLTCRVLVPATLPAYVVGLRSGLALGWMFVIAAELMGASEGLGFLMIDGQMTGRPAAIIASIIFFALLGKLSDQAIASVAGRTLSWQDNFARMSGG